MVSFEDAHAALLRNASLQFDFGAAPATPPLQKDWHWSIGSGGVPLTWVIVGLALASIVAVIWQYMRVRPPRIIKEASFPALSEAPTEAPVARASLVLGDADALAAEGRFLEAAHALLACGIAEIARLHPTLLRATYTSRDIAGLAPLPQSLRRAFGRIATAVELGVFGGRPIGAADYAECREAFLTSSLAGGV